MLNNLLKLAKLRTLQPCQILQNYSRGICVQKLNKRGIIQISGNDSSTFLQGLITNDINALSESKSIFCMFLQPNGRVLFDSIIYKIDDNDFMLECDESAINNIKTHLKMYKIRKNVNILDSNFMPFVIYDENFINLEDAKLPSMAVISKDPRTDFLGYRAIIPKEEAHSMKTYTGNVSYSCHRLKIGVAEGVNDMPEGILFPLEANCDYLNGVSFHKGCYIGQELTARVHHTGVVRKRIMPIHSEKPMAVERNTNILNNLGKSVGKVLNWDGQYGIGLMRIAESLKSKQIFINEKEITVTIPKWWPEEAQQYLSQNIHI